MDLFFNKGLQKYLRGDMKAAIGDLEKAIGLDPENEKTKKFLIKALVEYGAEFSDSKDYASALPLLRRAYELAPGDAGIRNIYTGLEGSLKAEDKARRQREQSMMVFIISLILVIGIVAVILILIITLRRNSEAGTAATRQATDRAVQLTKQQNTEISDKVNQLGSGIKDILTNQMERVLSMMEEQSKASAQETVKMAIARPDGTTEIRTDINPHIRARANGVELIEETIDDPETGERLIEPFLSDVDSRVRANAGKAMYKFNKEKAMVVISRMCGSTDAWMRLSGAWAMGEIGNDIAINALIPMLEDLRDFVVKRAISSLENILKAKGSQLEEEMVQKIKRRIKDARIQRKFKE